MDLARPYGPFFLAIALLGVNLRLSGGLLQVEAAAERRAPSWMKRSRVIGFMITIESADGTRSDYGHLSAMNVKPGQDVEQGRLIGWVGSTGVATRPNLYLAASNEGVAADVRSLFGMRP